MNILINNQSIIFERCNMDTIKDSVIQMIHRMPNDASVQDIMAELYFRQKVDAGLEQLDKNKGIEHSAVKERLKKWLE